MTSLCKTYIPQAIDAALEPIQNDEAQVKDYGHVSAHFSSFLFFRFSSLSSSGSRRRNVSQAASRRHTRPPFLHSQSGGFCACRAQDAGPGARRARASRAALCPGQKPQGRGRAARALGQPARELRGPHGTVGRLSQRKVTADPFLSFFVCFFFFCLFFFFFFSRWGDARSPALAGHEDLGGHSSAHAPSAADLRLAQRPVYLPQQLWDVFADFLEGRVVSLPWNEASMLNSSCVCSHLFSFPGPSSCRVFPHSGLSSQPQSPRLSHHQLAAPRQRPALAPPRPRLGTRRRIRVPEGIRRVPLLSGALEG